MNTLWSIFLEMGLVSLIIRWYSLFQTQEPSRFDGTASLVTRSLCQTLESIRFGEWGVPAHESAMMCFTSVKSGSSFWACSVFLILVFIQHVVQYLAFIELETIWRGKNLPLDLIKHFIAMHKSNPLPDSELFGINKRHISWLNHKASQEETL